MANADCKNIQNLIPLYLDNMLSDEENDMVRNHIASCDACKAEYELMASIMQTAASLPELNVPEGFHEKLMEKVKAEAESKQERRIYARSWRKVSGFAAAAAVIAVSVVSFMQLDRENNQTNPDVYLTKPAPVSTSAPAAKDKTAEHEVQAPAQESTQPKQKKQDSAQKQNGREAAPAPTQTYQPRIEKRRENDSSQAAVAQAEAEGAAYTPEEDSRTYQVAPAPAEASSAPQGSDSASTGGSGARSAEKFRIVSITVADSAVAEAEAILSAYDKDANGYNVGESLDAVTGQLSKLEGYQVITQTSSQVSAHYIVLQ